MNVGYHEQSAGRLVLEVLTESCSPRELRPLPVLDWTLRAHGRLLGTVPEAWRQALGRPIFESWRDRWQLTPLPDQVRDDGRHLRAGARIGPVDVIISIRLASGER